MILVACEESQAVTTAFRELGYIAFSCDIEPCSGEYPEWHIQADMFTVLQQGNRWDAVIAFPPCTHLASSGARWFSEKRVDGRQQAGIDFFMKCASIGTEFLAIENPVGIMSTQFRKPDQIIHPWQYGHRVSKKTCLWLKGLPPLSPTKIVEVNWAVIDKRGKRDCAWHYNTFGLPAKERAKVRSKTFLGIAKAMAEQWGPIIERGKK